MNVLTSERDNAIITIATFLFLFHPSLFPPGSPDPDHSRLSIGEANESLGTGTNFHHQL